MCSGGGQVGVVGVVGVLEAGSVGGFDCLFYGVGLGDLKMGNKKLQTTFCVISDDKALVKEV